jgi:hypothetical protein
MEKGKLICYGIRDGADVIPSFGISYPQYLGATFDASTTNLTYHIPASDAKNDPLEIVVSFLSSITPTSTLRQSIPASYIAIYVSGSFDVNVYIDVSGEWVSGDTNNNITWEFQNNLVSNHNVMNKLKVWKIQRTEEQLFTEHNDRAEWGTLHFVGPPDVEHECGTDTLLRQRFARTGTLQNAVDDGFRKIREDWPVFAYAKSFNLKKLPAVSGRRHQDSVQFTIAHTQDPIVQYATPQGLNRMQPLWMSYFPTAQALISFHYSDFDTSLKLANNYSEQLARDALRSGSEDYKDIVALSARQVLGATSFSGTPQNPILFMKEISSNGDFQTVDVIFPALPFFLYTSPRWLVYLLEPLIEHQVNGLYPNNYSMHDLGIFPNATGHSDGRDEYMPVEECGNMLIMGLALVNSLINEKALGSIWSASGAVASSQYSGSVFPLIIDEDGFDDSWTARSSGQGKRKAKKWIGRSYMLWKQWTGYLVREALIPSSQLSTDDFAGWLANQTNLALKGIIGIRAMSELSELMGEVDDAKYYRNISDVYIKKWEKHGMARDGSHAKLAYTWYGSWMTIYNLFADALLCFHLPSVSTTPSGVWQSQKSIEEEILYQTSRTKFVPENVYKVQSKWYHSVRQKYGLPLDNRHLYTKSDWQFFATAVASKTVREEIVQSIALWVNETVTGKVFTNVGEKMLTSNF